jgi:hypothetical protein
MNDTPLRQREKRHRDDRLTVRGDRRERGDGLRPGTRRKASDEAAYRGCGPSEVRYGLPTSDGHLRFPSWRGLRTDKTVETIN